MSDVFKYEKHMNNLILAEQAFSEIEHLIKKQNWSKEEDNIIKEGCKKIILICLRELEEESHFSEPIGTMIMDNISQLKNNCELLIKNIDERSTIH